MITALAPVVRQLEETYEALYLSLRQVPDEQLDWSPGGDTQALSVIAQHIARANQVYATVIGPENHSPEWTYDPAISRETLQARLRESLERAAAALQGVTYENIHESRCDDWCPNCEEQLIPGPLDAGWFALQMVRHTAYHLGQINLYLRMLGIGSEK